MAAQTSPDAHMPVFFALVKLETMHLLQDILFFNVSLSQIGPKSLKKSSEQLLGGGMEGSIPLNRVGGLDVFSNKMSFPSSLQ